MENDETNITDRLDAATALLEKALNWLEERGAAAIDLAGRVDKISATVEPSARETELTKKLVEVERELADLKAFATQRPLRRTVPASTTDMLAKHGIGEGPVDVQTLDAALAGLSLAQRIAVKSQLLRAGAIA